MKSWIMAAPALLALAACDGGTQGADATAEEAAANGDLAANSSVAPTPAADSEAARIPASLQGRWGLVAADCEPGRDDAKGLLTIGADRLEFYESVGSLDEVEEAGAEGITASFDFTGEGMEWERDMELALADGGETLIRREFGPDAAPSAFTYTKCS